MGIDRTTTGSLAAVATVLLVGMLVVAPLAATISVGATSTPGPPDFAEVSTASNEIPAAQQVGGIGAAADAIASSTLVNRSAATTSVSVTTVAATRGLSTTCAAVDGGPQYCDSPRLAINISDDVAHEGREVAVPKSALVDAVGDVPEMVFAVNSESGEQWSATTSVEDGYVVFTVPHFSTNTVTFAGEVQISGSNVGDGTQWTYGLDSIDSVANYSIDLTGVENTHWANESGTAVSPSGTTSTSPDGNLAPTGPSATGDPTLTVSLPIREKGSASTDAGNLDKAQAVDVSNGYAYVASAASNTLAVFDVADPSNPSYVASTASSSDLNSAEEVVVVGDYAYIADYDSEKVVTVDISTPSSPTVVDSDQTWADPKGMATDGSYLYVAAGYQDELHVLDISTPSNPSLETESSLASFNTPTDVVVDGNYAYVANEQGDSVTVVDISTPTSPTEVTSLSDSTQLNGASDLIQNGNYLYVGADSASPARLTTVDISTPSSPTITASLQRSEFSDSMTFGGVSGSHLYASTIYSPSAYHILDISTASSPAFVASRDSVASHRIQEFDVGSSTAYIPDDQGISTLTLHQTASSVDVSADDGTSASFGSLESGDVVTKEFGVGLSATSLDWTGSGAALDYSLAMREHTETEDVTVEVNGNQTSHSGALSEGSTTSLTTDSTWLRQGTNRVNITLDDDGSLAASAPDPLVDIVYQHDADDVQNISYADERWTQRYNVSKTFASDRDNAVLDIPHTRNIVGMRHLEIRWDGGGWTSLDPANYNLAGNDLTVDLAAAYSSGSTIPSGTTVDVRSNASRVETTNVTIEVLEASQAGQPLASQIRIKSVSGTPEIGVGPTPAGDRIHHLADESWSNPSEYAIIDDTGSQTLHLPNAEAGSTATVRNVSTEVNVGTTGGDVRVSVLSAGSPPRFDVAPGPAGSGDNVTFVYHDTMGGEQYELYSASLQDTLDKATANSPVYLDGSDENQVLEIRLLGGGGGAAVVAPAGSGSSTGPIPLVLVFVGVIVAIVAFVLVGRRFGLDSRRQTILLVVGGGIVGLIGLEVVSDGSVVGSVGSTIGAAFATPGGTIVAALAMFVGSFLLIRRLGLPRWMLGVAGIPLGIWVLDTLSSGDFTSGLGEISALVWLLLLIGGIAIVYRALKGRPVKVVAGRLR